MEIEDRDSINITTASRQNSRHNRSQTSFYELELHEIRRLIGEMGLPAYVANQLWNWAYTKGKDDIAAMSNIGKQAKSVIMQHLSFRQPGVSKECISRDGTCKWLLDLGEPATAVGAGAVDGGSAAEENDDAAEARKVREKAGKARYRTTSEEIETVYIPDYTRGTLCVSSQIGCTLTCSFCHTGTQKLVRNLTAAEIILQVITAKTRISDWEKRRAMLTNLVFMGMGEPFLNYEAVAKSIRILCAENGLNMSRKKITVSTSGIVPQIIRCADEMKVRLAISLHAVSNEVRDELVPINRKYSISELLRACRYYAERTGGERITFEYVMLDGVNDSDAEARQLLRLLRDYDIPAKINLIPFNPWPGSNYRCSSRERIGSFAAIIESGGYVAPVRQPRGQDIMAACGQLRSDSEKKLQATGQVGQTGERGEQREKAGGGTL